MAAMQDGEITKYGVVTVLQRYRLVSHSGIFGARPLTRATTESFAPNQARTDDREVMNVLSPNETVAPVTVTIILVVVPLIWLCRIVLASGTGFGGKNRRSLIE